MSLLTRRSLTLLAALLVFGIAAFGPGISTTPPAIAAPAATGCDAQLSAVKSAAQSGQHVTFAQMKALLTCLAQQKTGHVPLTAQSAAVQAQKTLTTVYSVGTQLIGFCLEVYGDGSLNLSGILSGNRTLLATGHYFGFPAVFSVFLLATMGDPPNYSYGYTTFATAAVLFPPNSDGSAVPPLPLARALRCNDVPVN